MKKLITAEKRDGVQIHITSLGPQSLFQDLVHYNLRGDPFPYQIDAIQQIFEEFLKQEKASEIISGHIGAGKTETALFLAEYIERKSRQVPTVFLNFDPTSKGLYSHNLTMRTSQGPVIVVLNEFDRMVKFVESNEKTNSDSSIAENRTRNIILLATTNQAFENFDQAYIRDGRFDIRLEFN